MIYCAKRFSASKHFKTRQEAMEFFPKEGTEINEGIVEKCCVAEYKNYFFVKIKIKDRNEKFFLASH